MKEIGKSLYLKNLVLP